MLIEIDENNYCTGHFDIAMNDTAINYVYAEKLPESYQDILKFQSTKCILLENTDIKTLSSYELDSEKYKKLLNEYNRSQEENEIKEQINQLKDELSETDYKVIKNIETLLPDMVEIISVIAKKLDISGIDTSKIPYDAVLLHNDRQEARDEVNKYEAQLLSVSNDE